MALELPKSRLGVRQIQTQQRKIPLEQIIAVQGQSPVATGLETFGNVLGQSLQRRAELKRQGEQLARLETLAGQEPGAYTGLDLSTATSIAEPAIKEKQLQSLNVPEKNAYTHEQFLALNADKYKPESRLFPKGLGVPGTGVSSPLAPDEFTGNSLNAVENEPLLKAYPRGIPKETVSMMETMRTRDESRDLKKLQQLALNEDRAARRNERVDKNILQYTEALERNPIHKKLREQQIGIQQAGEMAELSKAGNTVAASALGVKMAKAMGEVGVLTEQDVRRYVTSGRLDRKSADVLSMWVQGRPTEATLDEIAKIKDVMEESFDNKVQPIYNTYINRLSRNYGMTPEEAAFKMDIPYRPSKLKPMPQPGFSPSEEQEYQRWKQSQVGGKK